MEKTTEEKKFIPTGDCFVLPSHFIRDKKRFILPEIQVFWCKK